MSVRAALAAVLIAATSPSLAFAETQALNLLRATCVAHNAHAAATVQDLTTRNWRQLTDAERGQNSAYQLAAGFVMHWTSSQAWTSPEGNVIVVLGEGPLGSGEARADFCLVTESAPFRRQVREVRHWLGFDRFQSWGPGGDVFAYVRDDAGNFSDGAHPSDSVRAAMRAGRFGFVQVIGDDTQSAINFSVIDPVEPPQ